jgi:hypothetical protein
VRRISSIPFASKLIFGLMPKNRFIASGGKNSSAGAGQEAASSWGKAYILFLNPKP